MSEAQHDENDSITSPDKEQRVRIELTQVAGEWVRPDCPSEEKCAVHYFDGPPAETELHGPSGHTRLEGKVEPHLHQCSYHATLADKLEQARKALEPVKQLYAHGLHDELWAVEALVSEAFSALDSTESKPNEPIVSAPHHGEQAADRSNGG